MSTLPALTPAQRAMLDAIKAGAVVRSNHRTDRWTIDGRTATSGEGRVIDALQAKRLVRWVHEDVRIVGMNGTKRMLRLEAKA